MQAADGTATAIAPRLGEVFAARGFSDRGIRDAFGLPEKGGLWTADVTVALRRRITEGDVDPHLAALVQLFVLGVPTPAGAVTEGLGAQLAADAVSAGVLTAPSALGQQVRIKLVPEGDLIIASDPDMEGVDCVTGVNNAALTLSQLTVRGAHRSALDVGTGSGFQALLAARHCGAVVGTDINRHALDLAAFAAAVNGVDNVSWREGSWLEPVRGEQFDLIVANPPYVISPDSAHTFRDSGMHADSACRQLVRAAPEHLTEGGIASIMCNWVHRAGQDWEEPLREWIAGLGCDAILLHYGSHDPLTYAFQWNQPLRDKDPAEFRRSVERWLQYYADSAIEAIGFGGIVLRRRSAGQHWTRAFDAAHGPSGSAGDQLRRILEMPDWLAARPTDAALLQAPIKLVDGHRVDQTLTFSAGSYEAEPASMRLLDGAGLAGSVDPRVLTVLFGCDGATPLDALVEANADALGMTPDELGELTAATVRSLLSLGLVIAADG